MMTEIERIEKYQKTVRMVNEKVQEEINWKIEQ